MNKKLIAILVFLAIVSAGCVSVVWASEKVNVDGIDFNVPDGFKEDKTQETIKQSETSGSVTYLKTTKAYENSTTAVVFMVAEYQGVEVTDEVVASTGGEQKTINNVTGYQNTDGQFTTFAFEKDGKLAVVSTNDASLLDVVLVGN